jgi:HAE1 family hydrophobic/amphiphilic exporter-1
LVHLVAFAVVAMAATPSPAPANWPQPQVPPGWPAPAASPLPTGSPIPAATPALIAVPPDTGSLVLPPAPAIGPLLGTSALLPSGDIAGSNAPFVGLTLENAIGMALHRNTDLAVSQSNRRVAAYQIVAADGAYDVAFQLQPQYQYSQQAAISTFQAGPNGSPVQQVTAGATAGFTGRTQTGGGFSATTTAQRVDNNATLNSYDPYYQTSLALTFTQPLARNLAIDDTRRQIQLAKINYDLSTDNALLTASNTVDNVLNAYYNLVAAWKNVGIQEDALRQAKAQSESNARLVRQGQSAPVDVVESDTQVDEFQDDVYSAIANVASLQNQLKALILSDPADPAWTANLVPLSPMVEQPAEPAVDDLVIAALRTRPEVAQLRESLREENVNVAYYKDQTKPQIDVNAGITENGFAGAPSNPNANPFIGIFAAQIASIDSIISRVNALSPGLTPLQALNPALLNSPLFPGTVGKIGQSYKTALDGKFPEYTISATLSFPLRNRTAEADYKAELERRQQVQTQEVALIERVQSEARNAVQAYRSARSRLIAATAGRRAAEIVAASELRRFRAGKSTTFLVLQRQVTLANERGRELQAQTDVERSLVEIDRVSGAILRDHGVDVGTLGTGKLGPVPDLLGSPAAR